MSETRTTALSATAEPEVYLSFWQSGPFSKHLVLRAAADPRSIIPLVRQEIRGVDPTAAAEHFTTMAEIRRESFAPRTFAMQLLIGFAVLATGCRWLASMASWRSRSDPGSRKSRSAKRSAHSSATSFA